MQALRAFREFARTTLLGRDVEFDSGAEPPLELYRPLHEQGLLNWWLPEEFGGANLGLTDSIDFVSELAYADAGSAFTLLISILGSSMVSLYGSPALKKEFLTAMTRDGGYAAALGSEREAGSELINLTTTLTRRG